MIRSERQRRDADIASMHNSGFKRGQIAVKYGIRPARVHLILIEMGLVTQQKIAESIKETRWEAGPNRQRQAFWERQRRGAKAALDASRQ